MWRGWEKSHDLSVVVSRKISDLKLSYVAFKALIIYLDTYKPIYHEHYRRKISFGPIFGTKIGLGTFNVIEV